MYKIFINDKPFILTQPWELSKAEEGVMILNFSEIKTLRHAIKLMELDTIKSVVVIGKLKSMWRDFLNYFEQIDAAGGVVKNAENKLLFIYRLGKWDLPKGKNDDGETLEETAIREIEEECGISKLTITGKICTTYHTYKMKGKNMVKASHWFAVITNDNSKLKIQEEENITDACWASQKDVPKLLADAYPSITDVMSKYAALKS